MHEGSGLRAVGRATLLMAIAGVLAFANRASAASEARPGYDFFLDGAPFSPATVSVMGREGELAPGDLIEVNNLWLVLGEEHEYRFRSAHEGVLLELGDGRTRWVGVRVEPDYHGDGPGFVDGLAPLTPEQVHGLWGLRAETWTPSCAAKARFLDVSRVHLTLGQSVSKGHDDLPELPSGLRYLEAMHFVDWKNLERLRDLVYLDALPHYQQAFDLRMLGGFRQLKVLRLFSGALKHWQALASLAALEQLDLRFHDEVTDVGFAADLSRLRTLQIERTSIRDLGPLAKLTSLETVDARASLAERLPDGALPALRQLNVAGASVPAVSVAAFRRAHPNVVVRHGWNDSLRAALSGATRIRVGPGEGCAPGNAARPPYESRNAEEIEALVSLFTVDEERSGALCGCLGGAAVEFFRDETLLETVNLVCDSALRWSEWPGDGVLPPEKVTELLDWLAEKGVPGPRNEVRADQARQEAFQRKSARATAGWSPKLRDSFEQDGRAAGQNPSNYKARFFPPVLASEFPARPDRIRVLLRVLGADTGSWSGLDPQEVLAEDLLRTYERGELETVCKDAILGMDRPLRRGAARVWDSWRSPLENWQSGRDPAVRSALLSVLQEAQSPELRQRAVERLTSWWAELPVSERDRRLRAALHDPSEFVRKKAMLAAGQVQAAWAEDDLVGALAGHLPTVAPAPPVPPEEVETSDLGADSIIHGGAVSEAEFAGLALGYLRSRQAQSQIDERASATGSPMLRVARSLYDERCDLLTADDFHTTKPANQPLQLAAVEAIVRCRGKHALDLALSYRQASHWWEEERVAAMLRSMLLAADPPGADTLKAATTLPQLRGWYQQYGSKYLERFGGK